MACDGSLKPNNRLLLAEVNPHLLCVLCGGYYVDATTIAECLHSFCRSCIIKYLECKSQCPICDIQIHKAKPYLSLRSDKTLQDIVYKLVPGLFHDEMRKRKEFFTHHPRYAALATAEERGESTHRILFSPDDAISLSLEYGDSFGARPLLPGTSSDSHSQNLANRRYFQCPASVPISVLKKLIKNKYNLGSKHKVDVYYGRESLADEYTLMDVAYIFTWKRNEPMRFFYQIYEKKAVEFVRKRPAPVETKEGAKLLTEKERQQIQVPEKKRRLKIENNDDKDTGICAAASKVTSHISDKAVSRLESNSISASTDVPVISDVSSVAEGVTTVDVVKSSSDGDKNNNTSSSPLVDEKPLPDLIITVGVSRSSADSKGIGDPDIKGQNVCESSTKKCLPGGVEKGKSKKIEKVCDSSPPSEFAFVSKETPTVCDSSNVDSNSSSSQKNNCVRGRLGVHTSDLSKSEHSVTVTRRTSVDSNHSDVIDVGMEDFNSDLQVDNTNMVSTSESEISGKSEGKDSVAIVQGQKADETEKDVSLVSSSDDVDEKSVCNGAAEENVCSEKKVLSGKELKDSLADDVSDTVKKDENDQLKSSCEEQPKHVAELDEEKTDSQVIRKSLSNKISTDESVNKVLKSAKTCENKRRPSQCNECGILDLSGKLNTNVDRTKSALLSASVPACTTTTSSTTTTSKSKPSDNPPSTQSSTSVEPPVASVSKVKTTHVLPVGTSASTTTASSTTTLSFSTVTTPCAAPMSTSSTTSPSSSATTSSTVTLGVGSCLHTLLTSGTDSRKTEERVLGPNGIKIPTPPRTPVRPVARHGKPAKGQSTQTISSIAKNLAQKQMSRLAVSPPAAHTTPVSSPSRLSPHPQSPASPRNVYLPPLYSPFAHLHYPLSRSTFPPECGTSPLRVPSSTSVSSPSTTSASSISFSPTFTHADSIMPPLSPLMSTSSMRNRSPPPPIRIPVPGNKPRPSSLSSSSSPSPSPPARSPNLENAGRLVRAPTPAVSSHSPKLHDLFPPPRSPTALSPPYQKPSSSPRMPTTSTSSPGSNSAALLFQHHLLQTRLMAETGSSYPPWYSFPQAAAAHFASLQSQMNAARSLESPSALDPRLWLAAAAGRRPSDMKDLERLQLYSERMHSK